MIPHYQVQTMLQRASATEKIRAHVSDDRRSFLQANLVGMAPSPAKPGVLVPSLSARARATGLPLTTAKRALKAAEGMRVRLSAYERDVSWSQVCMYGMYIGVCIAFVFKIIHLNAHN